MKFMWRDRQQATYLCIPRSALLAHLKRRKERKAEAKRRFKAELAVLRSSWEAHIAEIAERFTLPSPEAASIISNAVPINPLWS